MLYGKPSKNITVRRSSSGCRGTPLLLFLFLPVCRPACSHMYLPASFCFFPSSIFTHARVYPSSIPRHPPSLFFLQSCAKSTNTDSQNAKYNIRPSILSHIQVVGPSDQKCPVAWKMSYSKTSPALLNLAFASVQSCCVVALFAMSPSET